MRSGSGSVKVDARESFFNAKIPTAMMCMSTRENIIELCTVGQNFPAVSYLGAYTFINCIIHKQRVSVQLISEVHEVSLIFTYKITAILWLLVIVRNFHKAIKINYFLHCHTTNDGSCKYCLYTVLNQISDLGHFSFVFNQPLIFELEWCLLYFVHTQLPQSMHL